MHVAFDIGNVLCEFDLNKFTNEMFNKTGIPPNRAYNLLESIQGAQDIGITTVRKSLQVLKNLPPVHFSERSYYLEYEVVDYLVDYWCSIIQPSEMMLNFLDNIKSDGVKVALLSNMGKEHHDYLQEKYPRLFSKSVQHISHEVGARKPNKLFFQSFLLDHDEFKGASYIDDIEENCRAAKKYSFKVYKFDLAKTLQLKQSEQKLELDRLRNLIISQNY